MAFVPIERHTFANGDEILVGHENGMHQLVFDGPAELETTICFNRVSIERNRIELVQLTAEHRHVSSGSIEGRPEDFGAVGAFLDAYAEDPEVVARA